MYMQGLRSSAIVRTYDHSIPLPETSFQTIQGYDKATDRFHESRDLSCRG